jgi:hypothetical protein
MASKRSQIFVPSSVGSAAFDELDRVPWAELAHAYGTGKLGTQLYEDVAATLRRFGNTEPGAFEEAVDALFSNLCHQGGTIYQSTAFALPFLAAFVAGTDLTPNQVSTFVAIFASIGIAASFEAPHGSHAGSYGPGVSPLTREALRASRNLLAAAARRNPGLHEVTGALAALVRTDPPDPAAVERLEAVMNDHDNLEG